MTFLIRERTRESYSEKISKKSSSLQNSTRIALNHFEKFCSEKYSHSSEDVIAELLSFELRQMESATCDVYQDWVNWSVDKATYLNSLEIYFSCIKSYMHYRGLKLTDKDIKENVSIPKQTEEEKYPLQVGEIITILSCAHYAKKSLYLILISSGMRVGETAQIRKKHIKIIEGRMVIYISAKFTKTKIARTVYTSIEATKHNIGKYNRINNEDLMWGTNDNRESAVVAEDKTFASYTDKVGLIERYDSGTRKITIHSFRAYYHTRAARTHDLGYAHKMTGHKGYLPIYDRLSDEEKLEMYLELEPKLFVYDQTINEMKIKNLKEANRENESLKERLEKIEAELFVRKNFKEVG